ncbi:MAG: sugar ABC transporter permease [Propionibacteriaceae bacterium]|jgi:raffinose/stachyose/melibiose transport system permease protein|nr:sugar ABC transporter permease [Propionibacteriaceae bacterium]
MTDSATTIQPASGPASLAERRHANRARRLSKSLIALALVVPAAVMYAVFVLRPLGLTIQYSFYDWNGIGASTWVGLKNYAALFDNPVLWGSLLHSFILIVFFCLIPVILGLFTANTIRGFSTSRLALVSRTVLFIPQIIPLVAAGIMWSWLLTSKGFVNQVLTAVGLGGITRAWLGDFDLALPTMGLIGAWVLFGLCMLLLLAGMSKIDPALYEAARIDGATAWKEFWSITLPSLKQEIGVCVTVTVVAALASFDIVYISTRGGPGNSTMVPGMQIYYLAFFERELGLASALAVALVIVVLAIILPVQRATKEDKD